MDDGDAPRTELTVYSCRECYVYQIPPSNTIGHRAELWNVDKWLQVVNVKVITCQDECVVRLEDQESGELFAECPVPKDLPITTAVEPVIDSSRYYVLRIVDPETNRHAFIGIGFRDRGQSSDFAATIDEHRQYLRRKREAAEMREKYEAEASTSGAGPSEPVHDYSLKPGETIKISLTTVNRGDGSQSSPAASWACKLGKSVPIPLVAALSLGEPLVPKLPRPPGAGADAEGTEANSRFWHKQLSGVAPSEQREAGGGGRQDWGEAGNGVVGGALDEGQAAQAGEGSVKKGEGEEGEAEEGKEGKQGESNDWGDFVG